MAAAELALDQRAIFDLILNYQKTMLKTAMEKRTLTWFKTCLEGLKDHWTEFYANHKIISRSKEELKEDEYFKDEIYDHSKNDLKFSSSWARAVFFTSGHRLR